MSVKVVAFITVTPGREKEFEDAARECVSTTRRERGVLHYDLWREVDGDRRYVFNELYVDHAAVDAHKNSDHLKVFGSAIRDLAKDPPVIITTTPVDVVN